MKKRLLSALLAVCMMLSVVPMLLAVSAEGETVVASGDVNTDVTWKLTGTPINAETVEGGYTLTITPKADAEAAYATISKKAGIGDPDPNAWNAIKDTDGNGTAYEAIDGSDGLSYTDAPWVANPAGGYYANDITTVIVEEGISAMARRTFSCMRNLETVQLPTSLRFIGWRAFAFDTSLKSIVLPEGLARINQSTFEGCTALSYVSIPTTLDLFASNWASSDINSQNVSNAMFKGCTSLRAIYLHNVRSDKIGKKPMDCTPFDGIESQITILCPSDSYAKTYAESAFKTDGTTAKPTIKVEVVDDKAAYATELLKTNPVSVSAFAYYIGENSEDTKTGIRAMITVDEVAVAKLQAIGWTVEYGYITASAAAASAADMETLMTADGAICKAAYADCGKLLSYTGGTSPINVTGKHVFTAELMDSDEKASYILTGYWKTVSPDGNTTEYTQANDGTETKFVVGESSYIGVSAEKIQGLLANQSAKKNS